MGLTEKERNDAMNTAEMRSSISIFKSVQEIFPSSTDSY